MSHLLPRSPAEFGEKSYWERFFAQRKKGFEWYGEFQHIRPFMPPIIPDDQVLALGAGNSDFSALLYDSGIHHITNIDFSESVIHDMTARHSQARPEMQWRLMDMTDLQFPDESFHTVIDKAALDALMCEHTPQIDARGAAVLGHVQRVLRPGGHYVCVSLLQEHILRRLLASFGPASGYRVEVHLFVTPESERPVFVFAATKPAAAAPALPAPEEGAPYIKAWLAGEDLLHPTAVETDSAAWLFCRWQVGLRSRLERIRPGTEPVEVALWGPCCPGGPCRPRPLHGEHPRRRAALPAPGRPAPALCAVFLVPQGREHEWMFTSAEGHQQLAESARVRRLAVVRLGRTGGHLFRSVDRVQAELSPCLLQMAPRELLARMKENPADPAVVIPYMTTSDGLGTRAVLWEAESAFNGRMVVEEVEERVDPPTDPAAPDEAPQEAPQEAPAAPAEGAEGAKKKKHKKKKAPAAPAPAPAPARVVVFRRLIPTSAAARPTVLTEPHAGWQVDRDTLASAHQQAMLSGLALLAGCPDQWRRLTGDQPVALSPEAHQAALQAQQLRAAAPAAAPGALQAGEAPLRVLVVGLGAGCLPMFLHWHFGPRMRIDALEIDPAVVELSRAWFGLREAGPQLAVHTVDGLAFLRAVAAAVRPPPPPAADQPAPPAAGAPGVCLPEGAAAGYDLVVLDADSKDSALGLTCPAPAFVEPAMVDAMRDCLAPGGMLMLNLVARSERLREQILERLLARFRSAHQLQMEEDLNRSAPQPRSPAAPPAHHLPALLPACPAACPALLPVLLPALPCWPWLGICGGARLTRAGAAAGGGPSRVLFLFPEAPQGDLKPRALQAAARTLAATAARPWNTAAVDVEGLVPLMERLACHQPQPPKKAARRRR
ncbi:hypothetical protein PAPYR_4292 [Paratrimastix pyriformis]|uniref:Methyltransferase domain-containing protein n=1 Tax=Paratrimastix pyriformis TaxID=342808 RepID=A0ABQ8UNI1_9EUKA|nr:hypothetical protein PAPYR_4292 [Paratrimastix pyriformis]